MHRLCTASTASSRVALSQIVRSGRGGDFLEDDLYEEWAIPLRERARAAYFAAASALAADAEAAGDGETAIRCHLRILERDPLHEHAHVGLVRALAAAGRHGDALRSYRQYCAGMRVIGAEPAPYGSLL